MTADGPFVEIDDLAARIPDGCTLAVSKDEAGVAMAATRALIRRGARDLDLLCVPVSGIQADLLIGAGCLAGIECSAVTLAEFGMAPRFRHAVQDGRLRIRDATCPAIYAALQAAEKGNPFAPIRGLIGSDVLAHRDDWKVTPNPFADGDDPIVVVPALRPDVALFHARLGDRAGNVWVANRRELVIMAHAARASLVTVEEIYDGDLIADEKLVAGTIPALYIDAVAHAPNGAWPLALAGCYEADAAHLRHYAEAARTDDGFASYLARYVHR
jgi:glutaconate CoA-transferase subunit A